MKKLVLAVMISFTLTSTEPFNDLHMIVYVKIFEEGVAFHKKGMWPILCCVDLALTTGMSCHAKWNSHATTLLGIG